MTSREKHLREALAQAKYAFNEIECVIDKLADAGMEDAEKAMQEAGLMNDGPSEEDKKWLNDTIVGCEEAIKLREDFPVPGGENIETFKRFLETALKLEKAWGMK